MLNLTVHDLLVVKREVMLTELCPHCSAKLLECGLIHFEYQDQRRKVDVLKGTDTGELVIEWGDHIVEAGEQFLSAEWQCGNCRGSLLESRVITIP